MRALSTFPTFPVIFLIAAATSTLAPGQQIVVNGDIPKPLTLTVAELAKMPHTPATLLEGDNVITYQGVALADILKQAGMPTGDQIKGAELTGIVIAKGKDGKRVAFAYAELDPSIGGAGVIVADQQAGKPVPAPHGPLHLVVSTDRGNARFIDDLQEVQLMHIPAGTASAPSASNPVPAPVH
jgi:DMSO/TMAO reductase YedYZ molybdopterin-dependent catalytic subunit